MEKMTVTRALAELKTLGKRIDDIIDRTEIVAVVQGTKSPTGFKSIEDFLTKVSGNLQSINDLIKRRNAIKAAVVHSNAATNITIAGNSMTVAEAIERKTAIEHEKKLLGMMRMQYGQARNNLELSNFRVGQDLLKLQENVFKNSNEALDAEKWKAANEWKLITLPDLLERIETLNQAIMAFEMEVDAALSESNSVTVIEL